MEILASVTVWAAAFVAFWAGMGVQAARTAVQNLRKTKESVPALRKAKRDTRFTAAGRLLIALLVASVLTMLAARLQ